MTTTLSGQFKIPDNVCAEGKRACFILAEFFKGKGLEAYSEGSIFKDRFHWGDSPDANTVLFVCHDGGEFQPWFIGGGYCAVQSLEIWMSIHGFHMILDGTYITEVRVRR